MKTAEEELATELFLKPRICGDGAGEVDDQARRPATVSVTAIGRRSVSKQSLSTGSSPRHDAVAAARSMQLRKRRSAWSSTRLEERRGALDTELLDQGRQPLGADPGRADHRAQVAVEQLGQCAC